MTCFYFLKKSRFYCNPSEKVAAVEKEVDGIDIDDIGNLEDLLRIVFIDEEFVNLQVVNNGGELTRNINQKKRSDVLQTYRYPLCDKCCRREYFFNNHVKYCESVIQVIQLLISVIGTVQLRRI